MITCCCTTAGQGKGLLSNNPLEQQLLQEPNLHLGDTQHQFELV
jgi:hypothetical protein